MVMSVDGQIPTAVQGDAGTDTYWLPYFIRIILRLMHKKGKAHAIVGLPYKSNRAESLHNLIVATVSLSNTRST